MPEAAFPRVELVSPEDPSELRLEDDAAVRIAADDFCVGLPYREPPYSKRNWGGQLHSLCSYQGKLKPAIAHFLVSRFTRPGDVVLDPMAGVGTIPLEARIQGRHAIAGDLSELATTVSKAKLERFNGSDVAATVAELGDLLLADRTDLDQLIVEEHGGFGLNGHVEEYFSPQTLREVLLARRYFRERIADLSSADAVVFTALLHILHGNRPYSLSRRSHPVTPLKPTGPSEHRPLLHRLEARLRRVEPALQQLGNEGHVYDNSFTDLPLADGSIDAVITSPPFAQSLRFFSSNWMRLWFCGWNPDDFRAKPGDFLERRQAEDFDGAYSTFLNSMAQLLRPGGLLVMHLGETSRLNMTARITDLLDDSFALLYAGRECVADTESHGLTDKGATRAHGFLFCRRT
jgi:hypothetical protein